MSKGKNAAIKSFALLSLMLLVYFWKVFLLGQTIIEPNAMNAWLPWSAFNNGSTKMYSMDTEKIIYPWRVLGADSLNRGSLPLWDPNIQTGHPLLAYAAGASGFLTPINLVFLFLSAKFALAVYFALHVLLLGFGTYLLLRSYGLRSVSCILAAIASMFNSIIILSLGVLYVDIFAWFPFSLLFIRKISLGSYRIGFSGLSFTVALQFLGAHFQTSLTYLFGCLVYSIFVFWKIKYWKRSTTFAVAAFILGIALSGVQFVPSVELWFQHKNYEIPQLAWHPPWHLITFISPNIFGDYTNNFFTHLPGTSPLRTLFGLIKKGRIDHLGNVMYIGILPLAFALLAIFSYKKNQFKITKPFLVIGLIALTIAMAWAALASIITPLNILSRFIGGGARQLPLTILCLSFLSGFGFNAVIAENRLRKKTVVIFSIVASLQMFLIILMGLFIVINEPMQDFAVIAGGLVYGKVGSQARTLEAYSKDFILGLKEIIVRFGLPGTIMALAFAIAGFVSVKCLSSHKISPPLFCAIILTLSFTDMFIYGQHYIVTSNPKNIFSETPAIRFLQDNLGTNRILTLDSATVPNTMTFYGLQEVNGKQSLTLRRYSEFTSLLENSNFYGNIIIRDFTSELSRLLNAKYILSERKINLPLAYQGEIIVYNNKRALPRAYAVPCSISIKEKEKRLSYLKSARFDPEREVVLEENIAGVSKTCNSIWDTNDTKVSIVSYDNERIVIDAKLPEKGWLLLLDAYYPGWSAYINGEESKIFVADHTFRTVRANAGENRVVFTYFPFSVKLGLLFTLMGFTCILVIFTLMRNKL